MQTLRAEGRKKEEHRIGGDKREGRNREAEN
jgi:hypothetical protein